MEEGSLLDDLLTELAVKEDKMAEGTKGRNAEKGRVINRRNPVGLDELEDGAEAV